MPSFRRLSSVPSSFLLLAVSILSACSNHDTLSGKLPPLSSRPEIALAPQAAKDVFQVGDNLELFVKEDPTLNSSYPVREGGYIVIPRAGRIAVAGLSRAEAESRVKESLQGTQLTTATVLVERMSKSALLASTPGAASSVPKIMVYVTGAVKAPGTHFVPMVNGRSLGIYETLLITGGLGRLAQDQRVEVMRMDASGRRHRATIDLRKVSQGQADDPPVGEGDIIHVPEKVFGF
jgi:polysaccharide export outer membrane protein